MENSKTKYILHLADNALILGQRLGEWCGHGPVLEQDMAMTNISLDYIGRARLLFQYVAELMDNGATEDSLAFTRKENEYLNLLLIERPNGHFGNTIARQFFADAFQYLYFKELSHSKDQRLAEIAAKTLKEIAYHLKWSSEWVIRLGDGTDISREKIQSAMDDIWPYVGEMFQISDYEQDMINQGIAPDQSALLNNWNQIVERVYTEAGLTRSSEAWYQKGGKNGIHTEHLGYLLSEMQFMQRVYPGMEW